MKKLSNVAEHGSNCFLLLSGYQVAITANHFFGLMANPTIDESLVHTLGSTVGTERVPQHMPTTKLVPTTVTERLLKMVVRLVH